MSPRSSLFVSPWLAAVALIGPTFGVLAHAQNGAVVPPLCAGLPGNAAVAMPLRWSHGALQVWMDPQLLPPGLVGQSLNGVRFRRSTLLGDGANPALTRTITVRGGYRPETSGTMVPVLATNRPTGMQVLFGPGPVTSLATPVPSAANAVGEDLLVIPFTTPLPYATGSLVLEFEVDDAPLQISNAHWVDAVWFVGAQDSGYAVTVGAGNCTSHSQPTELRWVGASPAAGVTGLLELRGVRTPPGGSTPVAQWLTLSPRAGNFGISLTTLDPGLVGCFQWAATDVLWIASAGPTGTFAASIPFPTTATLGTEVGAQAAWYDDTRPGLSASVSNGVVLRLGYTGTGNYCASAFFLGDAATSPWSVSFAQMPVLRLDY